MDCVMQSPYFMEYKRANTIGSEKVEGKNNREVVIFNPRKSSDRQSSTIIHTGLVIKNSTKPSLHRPLVIFTIGPSEVGTISVEVH